MFYSNVHPNPAIHRLATTVKEARATTRRDSPFQGTWKVDPEYLESLYWLFYLFLIAWNILIAGLRKTQVNIYRHLFS